MPEDFDPKKFLRETEPDTQFDPKEYLRTNPDPNRGVLDKATEVASGVSKGITGNVLGLTHFLPGDELPFLPESARQARRGARAEVQRSVDAPDASGYETAGRITGRDVLPMFLPLGGGRIAAAAGEGVMRAAPTLAQLVALFHNPLETLLGRGVLHQTGVLDRLQDVANLMAPYVGAGVGTLTRGAQRVASAEALNAYGRDDPNATQTPNPSPGPSPAPRAPVGAPVPGTPRGAPAADPGPDAVTDVPTAARSGRGDRLQPLHPVTND